MGVVIFAHVPPPHHGQSYAVQLLLERLRDPATDTPHPLRIFHVDARLSDDIEAIGRFQPRKILRLLRYCLQAIGFRLRHGARVLYYIPAAPMRSAVYRDWIVMALCRPFFRRIVFHWEAAGLGEWLQSSAKPWERSLTHLLLDRHTLSVVLARHGQSDAAALRAQNVLVVPNGIPDPCPDFESRLAPRRAERRRGFAVTEASPGIRKFRALYLSLCIPEKGLFDAVDAIAIANALLARQGSTIRVELSVAGKFWKAEDRERFDRRCRESDLQIPDSLEPADGSTGPAVVYRGFVAKQEKTELFEASDAFVFPSYYSAESFGLALAEAMAFDLPCIATRWRHIPEMFPDGYPYLVEPQSPSAIAEALVQLASGHHPVPLRSHYLAHFTDHAYAEGLRAALILAAHPHSRPRD
jgi:glycosyltransferase involved in cell wall biosynthesis